MVDALAERRVDVIAVSVASSEDALKRYGNRLRVFAKSDPFPGYGIAVSPAMDKDLALKVTQFFWHMDETPDGKAALAANMVGSSQGSTELREATTREYVRATEQIERLRKVYPAAATTAAPAK